MPIQRHSNVKFIRNSQLEGVELRFSRYRGRAFDKHTHDTYSIGIVMDGRIQFFCHDQTQSMRSSEIALINPGEVHACNPRQGSRLAYCMLYVEPNVVRRTAADVTGTDAQEIRFTAPVVTDPSTYRGVLTLSAAVSEGRGGLEVELLLCELLAEVLRRHASVKAQKRVPFEGTAETVETGRAYLTENLGRNVTLDELSSVCGVSPYHFLREFRKRLGLPPHAYLLQQRLNAAKRLLARGTPIAHVAAEVGFADQSHFSRKFKSCVGATPRQYQLANQ